MKTNDLYPVLIVLLLSILLISGLVVKDSNDRIDSLKHHVTIITSELDAMKLYNDKLHKELNQCNDSLRLCKYQINLLETEINRRNGR